MEQKASFKDVMNVVVGLVFENGGVDRFIQSIQLAIVMIGSNPFIG